MFTTRRYKCTNCSLFQELYNVRVINVPIAGYLRACIFVFVVFYCIICSTAWMGMLQWQVFFHHKTVSVHTIFKEVNCLKKSEVAAYEYIFFCLTVLVNSFVRQLFVNSGIKCCLNFTLTTALHWPVMLTMGGITSTKLFLLLTHYSSWRRCNRHLSSPPGNWASNS